MGYDHPLVTDLRTAVENLYESFRLSKPTFNMFWYKSLMEVLLCLVEMIDDLTKALDERNLLVCSRFTLIEE